MKVIIKRKFKEFVFFISLNSISIAIIIIHILQVTLHSAIANHEPFVSKWHTEHIHIKSTKQFEANISLGVDNKLPLRIGCAYLVINSTIFNSADFIWNKDDNFITDKSNLEICAPMTSLPAYKIKHVTLFYILIYGAFNYNDLNCFL